MNGEGNGSPLQYSCPENPMDSGAWQDTVLRVTKVEYNRINLARTYAYAIKLKLRLKKRKKQLKLKKLNRI